MRVIPNILLFLLLSAGAIGQTNLTNYEHWFDSDYASASTVAVTPSTNVDLNTNIDASSLTDGLHVFNIRFKDENGIYSSVLSKFFLKTAGVVTPGTTNIVEQEYWFDNDFAGAVSAAITPSQSYNMMGTVDASALTDGLHIVHFRFKDDNGLYSSVLSKFFLKVSATVVSPTVEVTNYEYWFDNDHAGSISNAITPSQGYLLIDDLDASALTDGLHSMHIRFKDNTGKWSSVLSKFFLKQASQTATPVLLTEYQYWFDNDFAGVQSTSLLGNPSELVATDLDASTLNDGLHILNIRFKDNTGKWSSVLSKFFLKTAPSIPIVAEINAYRWWIDSDFASHTLETLAVPANPHLLQTDLDLTMIPHGIHEIHFQFKDVSGKWSSVLTDTLEKLSLPIADFGAQNTMVCIGDEVIFINNSIDGDTHSWEFGDMGTSADSAATHIYTSPGVYDVTLTVTDLNTLQDSTVTLPGFITVGDLASPNLNLSGVQEVCDGESLTLTAESGFDYLWNTTESSQSIDIDTDGEYYVTITDQLNPSCITLSDTVELFVNPLPTVDLGIDQAICDGDPLTLDAGNPGATYLWNDASDQQTLDITATGEYSVEVTDLNGCSNSDTVNVVVNPLPVVDLGADISEENPPVTLDAGAGFVSYEWSTMESGQTIDVSTNGTYWVEVTDNNMCTNSDTIVVEFFAGLNESEFVSVRLYPNPASDDITIETSSVSQAMIYRLYDNFGRLIVSGEITSIVTKLDVSRLTPGNYFVELEDGKNRKSLPIIIQ
jgi:PKD repeat protein